MLSVVSSAYPADLASQSALPRSVHTCSPCHTHAGGAEIVGASLLWAQSQQGSSRSSLPGALVSVSLLLHRQPAWRLVAALQEAPGLLLPGPSEGGSSSSAWTGPALEAWVVDTLLAGAMGRLTLGRSTQFHNTA